MKAILSDKERRIPMTLLLRPDRAREKRRVEQISFLDREGSEGQHILRDMGAPLADMGAPNLRRLSWQLYM